MGEVAALGLLRFHDADLGRYGGDRAVLEFEVPAGTLVALQAPPKMCDHVSRLARGLEQPKGGKVSILGRDTATFDPDGHGLTATMVGVVAALPQTHAGMTLLENARVGGVAAGMDKRIATGRATDFLDRVGLRDRMHLLPQHVGSTELRWVELIRALVAHPKVLVVENGAIDCDPDVGAAMVWQLKGFALDTPPAGVLWTTSSTRMAAMADRMLTYSLGFIVDIDAL